MTRVLLVDIQNSCYGADHLQIEDIMLDWTPAEARAYFESRGQTRPDAQMVLQRKAELEAKGNKKKPVAKGVRSIRNEMFLSLLCDCGIINMFLEQSRQKKKRREAERQQDSTQPG